MLLTLPSSPVSTVLPFPECHIVGLIWYVAISDGLLSLGNLLNFSFSFNLAIGN